MEEFALQQHGEVPASMFKCALVKQSLCLRPTAPSTGMERLRLGQEDRRLCARASYNVCEREGVA